MTKNFRNYLLNLVQVMGGIAVVNGGRVAFEKIFSTDLSQLRWGIWTVWIIAGIWFAWRGYDGFFRKFDFWLDENDHRW